ncbi:DUF3095 family protein [Bradyrhizobium sp. Ash2021]|uniref:DUF3095 family protein n=1 Tax=Bradyrhizobium sp. Ash2021 TaxID=2954771 RepID=UPI00281509D3|nr:DUF3095 family protein [Bradyrhizobium sp. Ash2021]WMT76947.1 DUF3095 domain-containing protein [Bradyrhizobium sp. Ash2021]
MAANLTCFVPSPTRANHVHFVDGASGGYVFAAANLKRNVASGLGYTRSLCFGCARPTHQTLRLGCLGYLPIPVEGFHISGSLMLNPWPSVLRAETKMCGEVRQRKANSVSFPLAFGTCQLSKYCRIQAARTPKMREAN